VRLAPLSTRTAQATIAPATVMKATVITLARAHCWFDDLVSGRCGSMVEIAKCNGVGKQYVSRLIRLAFLAPEMVERIVAGRQPPELTAQALRTARFDIPAGWAAQKRVLGFAPPL
jgi:site-specific DNA recombinase